MQKKLLTSLVLLCLTVLSFSAFSNVRRKITNETNQTWIIVNQPHEYTHIYFDGSPEQGNAVCLDGSVSENGPCFLPPHATTHVNYESKTHGRLVLTDMHQVVFVFYSEKNDGLKMESNNTWLAQDDHGDLTIFRRS